MALHRRARDPADTDFLPPGAPIAQRVVFGSDDEAARRVHSSEPSSACARQITRHGFKVPRARSEPFPKAAESGGKIKFLTKIGPNAAEIRREIESCFLYAKSQVNVARRER